MNTLRYPSFFTGNGMVHNIRKLWLLPFLISFFVLASGCNESGLTGTDLNPEITSTTPIANANSVPVNTSISVTFSESMDSTSIHDGTFIVKIGALNIPGTFSYSDLTTVFTPSIPLGYGSTYSVMINSAVESLSGKGLADNYEWGFSTEEGANSNLPQVLSTNPAHNAKDVLPNSAIKVFFDKPMNSNSLNTSTFTLYQGNTPISGLVTSASTTATFSPFSDLSKGSTYRAVISSDVEDTLGNTLENDFEWSFTTLVDEPDSSPPQIQSVSPADNERDVPVDVVISASFSKALDDESVNSSTFMVTQNGNSVSGSIDLSGSTLSFTPNTDLPHGAEVTAVITTGVKDEAGNSLSADYEWSFKIMDESDKISPEVISTNPSANATYVDVVSVITATFSEPMNESTINNSTIIVRGGGSVSGSISYSNNKVTFTPNNDLQKNTTYTVTITTGVEDLAGNELENDFEWSFTTPPESDNTSPKVISTSPSDNAKEVDVNSVITATFSEPMNESTINNSTFIVTRRGTVSGSVFYSGDTITFTPNSDLRENRTYTVTITTGAEDVAGNELENDMVWTFRTAEDDDDDD